MAGPPPAGPSTSAETPPAHPALKPTAITPAVYARMNVDFKMRRNDDIRQNCAEHVDRILDRLDLATDTLLRPDRDNPALKLPTDDEVIADMAQQFLCLQNTAFVQRNVAAHEARTAFQVVNKLKPPEIKVKKVKPGRKEKKENVASAKVDRTPKEKATPVVPKTPQRTSVDETNDTPVAINKGKRRAAAVAVAAVSANSVAEKAAEKVEKSEKRTRKDAVKKRTSNRLSKTPRVNTKEEEEPTYCFCSRVSFGEMIGCDNEKCEIEWFHFECIGLTTKPKGKWFCPNCRHPDSARMPKTAKSAKKEPKD